MSEALLIPNFPAEPETIHAPGYIQPHGVLLVLAEDLRIVQISANSADHLGCDPMALLGAPITNVLAPEDVPCLQGCLEGLFECANPLSLTVISTPVPQSFQGVIHRSPAQEILLELEPTPSDHSSHDKFVTFYHLAKTPLHLIYQTDSFSDLCQGIVQEFQRLTGFDRVMLYRFAPDRHGEVIAEVRREHLEPMLGLHYPATDIPETAAQLFQLNLVRLMPDTGYEPVPIVCLHPETAVPVDMTRCGLRSATRCHRIYLQNMGVRSSLVVALVANQRLWGLISCQHETPYHVPYTVRTACEFIGQTLTLELVAREEQRSLGLKLQTQQLYRQVIDALNEDDEYLQILRRMQSTLLDLGQATGLALYGEETWHTLGSVPSEKGLRALLEWLPEHLNKQGIFVSHALPQCYPPAQDFAHLASGLLAVSITQTRPQYLLWFRPEVPQTVHWAGDPGFSAPIAPDSTDRLTPRASFSAWQEEVKQQANPWEPWVVDAILGIRNHVVSLLLRQADELAAFNLELQRSNAQLNAFTYIASHDLREPLRGIHNYATFLLEDYHAILDSEGLDRLQTLVRLSTRMEALINGLLRFSRIGRQEVHWETVDWSDLFRSVLDLLQLDVQGPDYELRIAPDLAPAHGDRSLLVEVFMNLISNGLKYNQSPQKVIEVGNAVIPESRPDLQNKDLSCFYVRDNGIGIRERHRETVFRIFKRLHGLDKYGGGTGVGLTIAQKIIEQHRGDLWLESTYGEGSTFYVCLPQRSGCE